jgi:hypothetical protein
LTKLAFVGEWVSGVEDLEYWSNGGGEAKEKERGERGELGADDDTGERGRYSDGSE